MKTKYLSLLVPILIGASNLANAQGTAFSYTGHLADNGNPANGLYNLRFAIFDSASAGNQIGPTLTNIFAVTSNGLFTVTLNFGGNVFTGPSRWLEIGARTNGSAAPFTVLTPRQALLPTPYAILAGTISGVVNSSGLSGVYSDALTMTNAANSFRGAFTGNGAGLTNLNAASLGGQTPSNFWQTAGNLNTIAGTHFLGTRDNQPLELRVNNGRVARFEPGANVTLGTSANSITNGVVGSTIAGGRFNTNNASESVIGGGRNNRIDPAAGLSSIGGGWFNTIQEGADQSVIGGGSHITIESGARESFAGGGFANTMGNGGIIAFIGSGTRNTNSGYASSIVGGQGNTIAAGAGNGVISGGIDNTIHNSGYATIPGGRSNSATNYAFAAGRRAKANHQGAFVWADSTDADFASSSGNQFLIRASGGVGVGTSDPEAFLHVTSAGFAAPQLRLEQTVNDDFARLRFTSTTKPFWDLAVGGANNVMNFYSFGNGNVMTLTTNGNLSVGGALTLFNADSSGIGALLHGYDSSGAGRMELYNTNSALRALLQGGPAAGMLTLYQADGRTAATLDGNATNTGGKLTLYKRGLFGMIPSILVEASEGNAGAGGQILMKNGAGDDTVEIDAQQGPGGGGYIGLSNGGGNTTMTLYASESGTDGSQILMYNGAGTINSIEIDAQAGTGGAYIGLRNAGGKQAIELDANNGTVTTQVIEITGGADFSENFDISGDAHEPGMIVSIDPGSPGRLVLSSTAYDKKVAGIISGAGGVRPGMLMGQRGSVAEGKHPVALTGRVYCWVDADANGAVEPGDMLTTSNTAGHGMKASDTSRATGAVIGKAMTGLDRGKGLVLVLVNLQ